MQKIGIGEFIGSAFKYWSKTLLFQILYSLIYFVIFYSSIYFFGEKYGMTEIFQKASKIAPGDFSAIRKLSEEINHSPNLLNFSLVILATLCFLFPLGMGFFRIFKKIDLGEKPQFSDMFFGYNGSGFFKYISFYLFWFMVFLQSFRIPFLPILWVVVTLFVAPLMFFLNKTIFEGISLTIKALRIYFIEILVCSFIAFALKYFGLFTLFAAPVFFPFWYSVIYALYSKIFVEKK